MTKSNKICVDNLEALVRKSDLVIEASCAKSAWEIARKSLSSGRKVMVMSVGGMAGHLEQLFILAKKHNDDIPRIIIQPVIFKGTYDEYNWNVLRERWDDLRAQLHGVVVPARLVENDEKSEAILKEISNCCPSFSPLTESL